MTLTDEQQKVVDYPLGKGEVLKVIAYAGTGKTSTLVEHAKAHPDSRILYLAFNRSVAEEAKRKFGMNVSARTVNSLAWGAMRKKFGEISQYGLQHSELRKYYSISTYEASLVMGTLDNYFNGADRVFDYCHVANDALGKFSKKPDWEDEILRVSRDVWERMNSTDTNKIKITHSGYLKAYQLTNPIIRADIIYMDEAQDTNLVTQSLVLSQLSRGTRVLMVGDPYQQIYCQVKDTAITMVVGNYATGRVKSHRTPWLNKPIQDVKVGDVVVSYSISKSVLHKTGNRVTKVGERDFKGYVVAVTTAGGLSSSYTPDHDCLVRMAREHESPHIVYLMRRGSRYRVGLSTWRHSTKQGLGVVTRAKQEHADALWIVSLHEGRQEAAGMEQMVSHKYGLPTLRFKTGDPGKRVNGSQALTQKTLDKIWNVVGDNTRMASILLCDIEKDIDYPLWEAGKGMMLLRRSSVIKACNLETGMEMLPLSGTNDSGKRTNRNNWESITVSREYYDGKVYSLEVSNDHTYVGDGIITHNCWRGAVDAIARFKKAPELRLTKSFRFGPKVAEAANMILSSFFDEHVPLVGNEDIHTEVGLIPPGMSYENSMILTRNTSTLLAQAMARAKEGLYLDFKGYSYAEANRMLGNVEDIYHLKIGAFSEINSKYIKFFANFEMFLAVCTDKLDRSMLQLVSLVKKYGDEIPDMINLVRDHWEPDKATVFMSTCHRMKGMEFDRVFLSPDFIDPFNAENAPSDKTLTEEMGVIYVACTRAKYSLGLSDSMDYLVKGDTKLPLTQKRSDRTPTDRELRQKVNVLKNGIPNLPASLAECADGHAESQPDENSGSDWEVIPT